MIQGVHTEEEVPIVDITLVCYDKEYQVRVANCRAPCNVLGIREIRTILPKYLNIKKIKKLMVNLAEVKVEPVRLPPIKPCFTPQYPIKGGMESITETVQLLLKEGIIAPTQSFNYNSPVWPVQKPNGKWRFTVDYRKINELSPKMPGELPDIESIWMRIRNYAPKWMATLDLSDMFFGIPIHPDSQEITTFTWQQKQYKFLRLPQGYLNSPIIAHAALMTTMGNIHLEEAEWLSYVDDLLVMAQSKEAAQKGIHTLVQKLRDEGWTINQDKIQGPSQQVKFLGVEWSATGPKIPDQVMDKLLHIKQPENKKQVQQLLGMFGFWRQHIPYMQTILQPLYEVTKKAADFEWTPKQQQAVQTIVEYIQQYRQLTFPSQDSIIILEAIFYKGYGSWNLFHKDSNGREYPMGFYTRRFPWVDSKYSLFEKTIWTIYEAARTIHMTLENRKIILRTQIPVLDWIKAPGEAWAGLPIEPKVLQWKWYLQNMIEHNTVSRAGKIRESSENILIQEVTDNITIPIPAEPEELHTKPIGKWCTIPYTPQMKQAWFTDGSATTVNNIVRWKAAAFRPSDGKILTQEGTDKSAQHAEIWAALLAVEQVAKEGDNFLTIYTDSWCVANGIAIWSAKWKKTDWKIAGKPLWSIEAWKRLADLAETIKIGVYHVDAHQNKKDDTHKYNSKVDELSKIETLVIKLKAQRELQQTGPFKFKIKTSYKNVTPQTCTQVTTQEITDLHIALGHIGTHALKAWLNKRNIAVPWHKIKDTIKSCTHCTYNRKRFTHNYLAPTAQTLGFNYVIQIDFIGPLSHYKGAYVCTMVDCTTGLGAAKAGPKPDQQLTMMTIMDWISHYGTPQIIQSDQGTHFTGKDIQRFAKTLDITWEFHTAYNPRASGYIERFNGLLKTQLQFQDKMPLHKALPNAILELNNRYRLHRESPFREALRYNSNIEVIQEPEHTVIRPYHCVRRNNKDNSLSTAEIVAQGTDNSVWTTQGKGDLKLTLMRDIA